MTMTTVYRLAGKIINIGPWDYCIEQVPRLREDGYAMTDEDGNILSEDVVRNPLPDGAAEDTADIITGWDGGLYEAGDPRAEGPGA